MSPVSKPNPWGGYTVPLIITILGLLFALFVDLILFIVFVAVLGYYLYRLEKRISALEGSPTAQQPSSK